ncbi:hypothetical protein [uncultured Parvimonas sp.]|uniref:hypothetical protein n=1 Tax=uncultured Parvimonas sp. TaxID=747372 RepID=UPI002593D96A|nr:hypothetical protein [uncultured Parvimonas sp.]
MNNKFFNIFNISKLKKVLVLSIIFIFSFSFTSKNSFADDNFDRANRIYDMDYRSFFIGNIVDDSNGKFKVKVTTIFLGENLKEIEVPKFKEYSYSRLTPAKGDYFVGILKKDSTLDLTWIFKATSGNYQTLYLANDKDPDNSEIKLFQNMINKGDYVPNLDEIERNKRLEANKYSKPKDDFKKNYDELTEEEKKNRLEAFNEKSEKDYKERMEVIGNLLKNPVLLIVPGILFLAIFYVVSSRRKYLKEMEERIEDEYDE